LLFQTQESHRCLIVGRRLQEDCFQVVIRFRIVLPQQSHPRGAELGRLAAGRSRVLPGALHETLWSP
jgi:hypothetical protein